MNGVATSSYGRNEAVGGHYILGYAVEPGDARNDHSQPAKTLLLWHANYHPDGAQLFSHLRTAPSSCHSLYRATTSDRSNSFAFDLMHSQEGSTSTRTFGTKGSLLFPKRNDSSTNKGRFTLACRSILLASSAVYWKWIFKRCIRRRRLNFVRKLRLTVPEICPPLWSTTPQKNRPPPPDTQPDTANRRVPPFLARRVS